MVSRLPRAFEVVLVDGLYARAEFFRAVIERGEAALRLRHTCLYWAERIAADFRGAILVEPRTPPS